MKKTITCVAFIVVMCLSRPVAANDQQSQNAFIPLPDGIIAAEDVSAVEAFGSFLLIGADEAVEIADNDEETKKYGNSIQLLRSDKNGNYLLTKNFLLFSWDEEKGAEMDIEAIAADMDKKHIYVAGSHSKKREKLEKKEPLKNRTRLTCDQGCSVLINVVN